MTNRVVAAAIGATVLSLAIGKAGFAEEMKKGAKPHAMDEKAMMEATQYTNEIAQTEHGRRFACTARWNGQHRFAVLVRPRNELCTNIAKRLCNCLITCARLERDTEGGRWAIGRFCSARNRPI